MCCKVHHFLSTSTLPSPSHHTMWWWQLGGLLQWMQVKCIQTIQFIFTAVSITVGATPFRECPPDAPPSVALRLMQMVRNRKKPSKILVLDLDETLIHASKTALDPTHFDVIIRDTEMPDGRFTTRYVCERPYLQYFLAQVSQWFTIAIFTAATKEYASPIITKIDRSKVIKKKYFRNDCEIDRGHYVKNLSRLHQRKVYSSYIIIDNLPVSYKSNPNNAIPISSFSASNYDTDTELLKLLPLLEALSQVNDVRSILELRSNPTKEFADRISR